MSGHSNFEATGASPVVGHVTRSGAGAGDGQWGVSNAGALWGGFGGTAFSRGLSHGSVLGSLARLSLLSCERGQKPTDEQQDLEGGIAVHRGGGTRNRGTKREATCVTAR